MNNIKKTTAALELKRKELANLEAQSERAQSAIDAVAPGNEELEKLRQQRSDEIGRAFIDKRQVDLASSDKAIAKIEKEVADIRAASEAGKIALDMLQIRRMEIEQDELPPLQEAQDGAINAFAAMKDEEAQAMLKAALEDVNKAFEHMAAAFMIDRKPVQPGQYTPAWKHRLEQLVSSKLNVRMDSEEALDKLKAELSAAGVTDPGVKRIAKRERPVPSVAAPDSVVKITFSQPQDTNNFTGRSAPGLAVASNR